MLKEKLNKGTALFHSLSGFRDVRPACRGRVWWSRTAHIIEARKQKERGQVEAGNHTAVPTLVSPRSAFLHFSSLAITIQNHQGKNPFIRPPFLSDSPEQVSLLFWKKGHQFARSSVQSGLSRGIDRWLRS